MKYLKLTFVIMSMLFGTQLCLYSQQSIISGGNDAKNQAGSISYSIGQLAYKTHSSSEGAVSEGIQQGYAISAETGLDKTNIQLTTSIYPNPVIDYLILNIYSQKISLYEYYLYDINGVLLEHNTITSRISKIQMSEYKPACYFLKIRNNRQAIKIFKIIKK